MIGFVFIIIRWVFAPSGVLCLFVCPYVLSFVYSLGNDIISISFQNKENEHYDISTWYEKFDDIECGRTINVE